MHSLLIADDDASVRSVLREFVGYCCPEFTIAGEATNGAEAIALASELQPHVILMDIRMPVMDGIQATRRIKQELGLPAVVVTFTSYTWSRLKEEAMGAGASFYLTKPFNLEHMKEALERAATEYPRADASGHNN